MPTRVPTLDELLALPTDTWSALLPVALRTLRALPDDERDAEVTRTVAVPPARLVAGRQRERLAALLRRPGVWPRVAAALPDEVAVALDRAAGDGGADPVVREAVERADAAEQAAADARAEAADAGARAARLRDRLEDARRAAEGAEARALAAEERAAAARADRDAARATVAELRSALEDATVERERAVERERRRATTRDDRDREALRAARRAVSELEEELRACRERLEVAERAAARVTSAEGAATGRQDDLPEGGRRGRPSVLPAGVRAGTREAAAWLVSGGVPLLVDGYNVSRQHRPSSPLDEQRRWLEGAVAVLAQRRGVHATIVWDSTVGSSTARSRTGMTVRFTTPTMTADDELVLHVETLLEPDDPVVVVTDDAELRERLAALGVDLLDTASFTWLLR